MSSNISLDELHKKVQYVIIDSDMLDGTPNNFNLNLSLESNIHIEEMSKVIGVKIVNFNLNQLVTESSFLTSPRYLDIMCDQIPKRAQILNELSGQILGRVPVEQNYRSAGIDVYNDEKNTFIFQKANNYFNPISLKKLNFKLYEKLKNGIYRPFIIGSGAFYMTLEITTIDVKEKPKNREVQILQALNLLNSKIDELNKNVVRIPTQKEEEERQKKKYPFAYLLFILVFLVGLYVTYVNYRPKI